MIHPCGDDHHDFAEAPTRCSDEAVMAAAGIFKALSDVPRLRILEALAQGEFCVTELARLSGDEISTVSQRLRVLKSERLVKDTRRGKHKLYSIADQHVLELVRNALAHAQEKHAV